MGFLRAPLFQSKTLEAELDGTRTWSEIKEVRDWVAIDSDADFSELIEIRVTQSRQSRDSFKRTETEHFGKEIIEKRV